MDKDFPPFHKTYNLKANQDAAVYYAALNAKNQDHDPQHNLFHEINPGDLLIVKDRDAEGLVVFNRVLCCCLYQCWDRSSARIDYPSVMGVTLRKDGTAEFPEKVYYGVIEHEESKSASIVGFEFRVQLDRDDIFALMKKFKCINVDHLNKDLVELKQDLGTSTNIGMIFFIFILI